MRQQLSKANFHDYQREALAHLHGPPGAAWEGTNSMLWLGVGLGKTATLETFLESMIDQLKVTGALVFAPKRVCRMVWRQEPQHWEHLDGKLTFSLVDGANRKQRLYALRRPANVHLVNYEYTEKVVGMIIDQWLSRGLYPPWNTLVFDEVDKLKDPNSKRSRALQRILGFFPNRIGMTGTPASEGYVDLFGQYLVVDGGQRLGTSKDSYLTAFFDRRGYKYELKPGAQERIKRLIADITFQHSQRFTPTPLVNDIYVDLPPKARQAYDRLEREMFMQLDSGAKIEVFNEASLLNKCLQVAQGHPYVEPGTGVWEGLHTAKLDALQDIVDESQGDPILVGYQFKSDLARIRERFPDAVYLGGALSAQEEAAIQADWDAGRIRMLVGHPASMGHGLNLQYGGHIVVWFGLTWSRRLYEQLTGRVDRQGQKFMVVVHRILARKTADEVQLSALNGKEGSEVDLLTTINDYRRRRTINE